MNYKLEILFKGQVPKEEAYPNSIEDYFVISQDCKVIAVCDGASESFDSKSWAELLSNKYVQCPELTFDWLLDAVKEYANKYDFDTLSWSKQASFARGSFSTLLGLQFCDDAIDILAIGDSIAILIDDSEHVASFPYDISSQFRERPILVSTNIQRNQFIENIQISQISRWRTKWDLSDIKSAKILCMTDALAEWALRNHEEGFPVWDTLLKIRENTDLCDLVADCRMNRGMKVDDSTLIVIELIKK